MEGLGTVRELEERDLPAAFLVMRELRGHLALPGFQQRIAKQALAGYRLLGAFDDQHTLLGVLGMRPVSTLARGDHLHIDDLVVTQKDRYKGIGTTLLRHAERWAKENGLGAVFLDSRQDVVSFYASLGYQPHDAILMKKRMEVA
jgi:GNAT superfamily N-acetyltransferase